MKRSMTMGLLLFTAMILAACGKKADAQETASQTQFETVAVETVVAENASGPEDVTVIGDMYENYPEDKKPGETAAYVQIRYFYVKPDGVAEDFDAIEGTECTPEDLMDILVKGGTLSDQVTMTAYEADGSAKAVITLNKLEGASADASEELLAKAVANTFCDNLFLDEVTIKAGGKTYGPLQFEY